jgi:D-lactate dehydrogenase (cytochrome)
MIIKSEQNEIQDYLKDASNTKGYCDAVAYPESSMDIINILKGANEKKTKVTVCGNRTGLTGASVPMGGIVLSTEKMNKILEINTNEKFAIVEPGVLLSDFLNELKTKNLYYPPDPTELNCFIGGTVATNASGSKTFKYGPTRDFILGMELVLPTGATLKLERGQNFSQKNKLTLKTDSGKTYELHLPELRSIQTKNAAGYFCKENMDAIDLFIGSEGTLGIITKIKLKLLRPPEDTISCVLFFDDESNALNLLEEAREASYQNRKSKTANYIDALALEFFDKRALKFLAKDFSTIPENAKAAIWFEQECTTDSFDSILEAWNALMQKYNVNEDTTWFAFSDVDKEKIKDFRHAISWKVNEYVARNNFRKLGTDVAVPDKNFREFYFTLQSWVKQSNIDFVTYGHFGNSHIHLNFLPKNDVEFNESKNLYKKICEEAVRLGGTISAEHGVGKNKTALLKEMYGDKVIKEMFAIKKTLDPNLILGYGNIFAATN